jgi:hypothetical protein
MRRKKGKEKREWNLQQLNRRIRTHQKATVSYRCGQSIDWHRSDSQEMCSWCQSLACHTFLKKSFKQKKKKE